MSTQAVWRAIQAQAMAWKDTPAFARFSAQLPSNVEQPARGVPALLAKLDLGGAKIAAAPLRAYAMVPRMLQAMNVSKDEIDSAFISWRADADRVHAAHQDTIAWLRSRLPGYPRFHAPHLARGTAHTTEQFTYCLTWAPGERSRGLGTDAAPPRTATPLQATDEQCRTIALTAQAVAEGLRATSEWQRLAQATATLDEPAIEQLAKTRKALHERLAPERVDNHEPRLALPRDAYRRAVLAEEIAKLSGIAEEYSNAFEGALRVLAFAADDVFGQFAAHGPPAIVAGHSELELEEGPHPSVAFSLIKGPLLRPGRLIRIADPLVQEVLRVSDNTITGQSAGSSSQRINAHVLQGTATLSI